MKNRLCGIVMAALLFGASFVKGQDSVTTLAGETLISGITNGPATNALFNDPAALVADAAGNIYIADSQNHVIRKIFTNGLVSTFAGQAGIPGSNNGIGTQAQFNTPSGIALAMTGDFYVSDTGNHTIRKITPLGNVTTIAGTAGQSGFTNAVGSAARFSSPLGIIVATNGIIYVADCGNHTVRAISSGGAVTTLAGSPESWGTEDGASGSARFNGPVGLSLDHRGDLFVSDSNNHTIRKITPDGIVATWAGVPLADGYTDGDRLTARFAKPAELAFDKHGNLFVADSFNHLIRKISTQGNVVTVTGLAAAHGSADGSNGQARLFNPYGLAICPDGSLIIADTYNELIRLVRVPFTLGIQLFNVNGNHSVTISWDSLVGTEYQVQYRGAVGFGSWIDLGAPMTATNLSASVTHDLDDSTIQRIYRVVIVH